MRKQSSGASKKAGLAPGTIIHVGEAKTGNPRITLINYNKDNFEEKTVESIEDCFLCKDTETVSWINVDGVHQVDIVEKIGTHFGLHPLVMEDIVHTEQRPKMEDFESYIYLVIKMLQFDDDTSVVTSEQVSIILGSGFVLSFQEVEGDTFDHVRERIRNSKGRIRSAGASYLAYALMDSIVDNYFVVLEKIGEYLEVLEEDMIENPTPAILQDIHMIKKEIIYLRRSVWPLREVINNLDRSESPLVEKVTVVFLKDLYDHTIRIIETAETYRDITSGIMDVYLSSVSNKMNEVMKTLTIIATIFIPLTFIAGVYGMNFEHMPELDWEWGYLAALTIMATISVSMLIYFRRKRWL
jgi:magnesium transporter